MNKFADMSFEEVAGFIFGGNAPELSGVEKMQAEDRITSFGALAAQMLDATKGINPYVGKPIRHGMPNRRSYTYKVRKALGYSYP